MDRYKKIQKTFELASIGGAAALAKATTDFLISVSKGSIPGWFSFIAIVLLVPVFNELVSHLLELSYGRLRALRELLLGDQFVEGAWIEFVYTDNNVSSIAFGSIEPQGYELQIHGCDYDLEGNLNYDFCSEPEMVRIDWPVFRYAYACHPSRGTDDAVTGAAHVKFGGPPGRPIMYFGTFTHRGTGEVHAFEGWFITDSKDLKDLKDPSALRQIMRKYLEKRAIPKRDPI